MEQHLYTACRAISVRHESTRSSLMYNDEISCMDVGVSPPVLPPVLHHSDLHHSDLSLMAASLGFEEGCNVDGHWPWPC